jgi:hypothetical protein
MDWPLVKITWIDSCEPYTGWQHIASLKPPDSIQCISVGYLVDDGERTKTIAPHITHPVDEHTQGCGIIVIPTKAVLLLERLAVTSVESC